MFRKEVFMPICDICAKPLDQSEVNRVSASKIIQATSRGFIPSKLPLLSLAKLFKISREEMWYFTVDKNRTVDWGLCDDCLSELNNFLQRSY